MNDKNSVINTSNVFLDQNTFEPSLDEGIALEKGSSLTNSGTINESSNNQS